MPLPSTNWSKNFHLERHVQQIYNEYFSIWLHHYLIFSQLLYVLLFLLLLIHGLLVWEVFGLMRMTGRCGGGLCLLSDGRGLLGLGRSLLGELSRKLVLVWQGVLTCYLFLCIRSHWILAMLRLFHFSILALINP